MPEKMGRGEFLRKLAAAAATTLASREALAGGNENETREKEKQADKASAVELFFDLQSGKLEVPKETKEPTEGVWKLVKALGQYEQDCANMQGEFDESAGRKLWKSVSAEFPNVSQDYSRRAFIEFAYKNLPQYLAQYGIYCIARFVHWSEYGSNKLGGAVPTFSFYKIEKHESGKFDCDIDNFQRDILRVLPLQADGELVGTEAQYTPAVMQTFGQNIVVREDLLPLNLQKNMEEWDGDYQYFVNQMNGNDTRMALERAPRGEQDSVAVDVAYVRLARNIFASSNPEQNKADRLDMMYKHETGHVVHFREADYRTVNRPERLVDAQDVNRWLDVMVTRTEIRAKIFNLIFGNNKNIALLDIFEKKIDGEANLKLRGHIAADTRLREALLQELIENPDYYGLSFDQASPISLRNQAAYKIADIADNSEKMQHLGRSLWAKAKKDGELSAYAREDESRLQAQGNAETGSNGATGSRGMQKNDANPCGKGGLLGGLIGVGGLALAALYRIIKRRDQYGGNRGKDKKPSVPDIARGTAGATRKGGRESHPNVEGRKKKRGK